MIQATQSEQASKQETEQNDSLLQTAQDSASEGEQKWAIPWVRKVAFRCQHNIQTTVFSSVLWPVF